MKLIAVLLIGVLGFTRILGEKHKKVVLEVGKHYPFTNPLSHGNHNVEWDFQVHGDNRIRLVCNDVIINQPNTPSARNCSLVYLSVVDDGHEEKVCNSRREHFVHNSKGRHLKVKLVTSEDGEASFKCTAMTTSSTEEPIKVKANRLIKIRSNQGKLNEKWAFESPNGTKISFQCNVHLPSLHHGAKCGHYNVVKFYNGESVHVFCITKRYTWFSKANKGKLEISLSQEGHRNLECRIQAVTGSNADEYKNIPVPSEDSSFEHGIAKGIRNTSCDCGRANRKLQRILYGTDAEPNEYPWMARIKIGIEDSNGSISLRGCGGSVITARHILTAAHCVAKNGVIASAKNVQVTLAKHYLNKHTHDEIKLDTEKIFVRNNSLTKGFRYGDIAIIFTKQTIDFSSPLVGPVCIEREPYEVLNKHVRVMGWGENEEYKYVTTLKKGRVIMVANEFCPAPKWSLCATMGSSDLCKGDSGGPYVIADPETNRYAQISLVSRGIAKEERCKEFQVSTLVSYYYNWIQDTIKATDPSMKTCHKI